MSRLRRPAVWLAFLGLGCVSPTGQRPASGLAPSRTEVPGAPRPASAEPADSARPAPTGSGPSESVTELDAAAPREGAASEPAPKPTVRSAPVAFEGVHPFGHRPVPADPVLASAHDTELGRWNLGANGDPAFIANRAGYHPATRVFVETKLLSGKKSSARLTAAALLAQARSGGYWPFRLCFEAGVRAGSDRVGKSVLRFSIDPRGRVSYARRMHSDLDKEVSDCLRRATYGLRFNPPPARRVDVELTVRLARGDVPLPPRDPGARAVPSPALEATLRQMNDRVANCYADGLTRDDALFGRIALRVRRAADGSVTSTVELHSRFPDPAVTECVVQLLTGQKLAGEPHEDIVVAWRLGQAPPDRETP